MHEIIATLRDQLDEAQEELRQLRQLFAPKTSFPQEWHLTPSEAAILSALYTFKSGALSTEAMHAAVSTRPHADERKLVHVYICKLRKKLGPMGIEIECSYGYGYRLTQDSKSIIRGAFPPVSQAA